MKRILVPVDFSEQAGYALSLACEIAEKSGGELVILHVIDHTGLFDYTSGGGAYPLLGGPVGIDYDQKFLDTLHANAAEKMDQFVSSCGLEGVNAVKKIKIGNPYFLIREEISEEKTNLVVIGSKGSGELEEALIGSTTEKVVRLSKVPVLTVKSKIGLESVNDIAFASNFTEDEAHITDELKKLQEIFNAKLHLVRINTPNCFETTRKTIQSIKKFVELNNLKNYTINIYNDKVEEDGIIYFAQDIEADLIAMATHGRSGILHLLSGSIAEDVVNHAKRPVWTFHLKH